MYYNQGEALILLINQYIYLILPIRSLLSYFMLIYDLQEVWSNSNDMFAIWSLFEGIISLDFHDSLLENSPQNVKAVP